MASLITVKDLTLGYGDNIVIKNANLTISNRDFACVVGANGSGKSTLIKSILGLIKPKSGQISFKNGLTQQNIGYLPQEHHTDPDFPALVKEIVISGALGQMQGRPFYGKVERELMAASLQRLGITNIANGSFAELSGGQKQKVLLARALTATTKLLILDEPSNNLDHQSKKDFYHTLQKLNQEGLAIIMITHDLDAEDLIGNKIISIENGKTKTATTAEFLERYNK